MNSQNNVIGVTAKMFGREYRCVTLPGSGRLRIQWTGSNMSTEFCQKCKQSHPGRLCDYNDQGECAETTEIAVVHTETLITNGNSAGLKSSPKDESGRR